MTQAGPQHHSSTHADSDESASEALDRAALHARRACAEALEALRALLDAAALGLTGQNAERHAAFATFSQVLADLAGRVGGKQPDVAVLILDALNDEIRRWEARSQEDPEARSVLRAFLGLREILWEFGVTRQAPHKKESAARPAPAPAMRPAENSE